MSNLAGHTNKHEIQHPLDPVSAQEISHAAGLLKNHIGKHATFSSVALVEPDKEDVLGFSSGDTFARRLRFMGYDQSDQRAVDGGFDAEVNLSTNQVVVRRITLGQAPIGFADAVRAIRITKEDKGWQDAMRARGINDFELVQVDPWPSGGFVHAEVPQGHRVHRAISFCTRR